jgi:hypothetical protein
VAWDDLDFSDTDVAFPSLHVALSWVEAHCIVPDGFRRGDWFDLVKWQAVVFLNHYRVKPDARPGQLSTAFEFRRSQVVLPQKAGKAPWSSAQICLEGVGPALFAGWARGGEMYDCRDHGCGCGWSYEYSPGEPMGQRWPTPLIQITATSEDQTANIYSALRPMIEEGPLSVLIPHTGEEFIRLPNNGRIDPVTSSGRSRLGQRVTFVPWDETGLYLKSNKMFGYSEAVYDAQRRGLGGMQGRGVETTNAWDPTQNSAAQATALASLKSSDIYRYHPMAPKGLSYTNKAERRKIHRHVYAGCTWIDLDAIEGEAGELVVKDPGQAERFYGNRPVAGQGVAFNLDALDTIAQPKKVPPRSVVVLGVDGARYHDALAVVACDVRSGYVWPVGIWERPEDADDEYEHPRHEIDGAVRDVFERHIVWRAYCDDQYIDHLIEGWANEFGHKRIVTWHTNRPRPIAWAVRNLEEAIVASAKEIARGEPPTLTHSGDPQLVEHFANARKRTLTVLDDLERPMHTLSKESDHSPLKIDGAMAAVLAWEARGDAIAAGAVSLEEFEIQKPAGPESWKPGSALDLSAHRRTTPVGPMGSMG